VTQVILPHTIDSGTEITAVEHQENYVALRDTVNGLLEGGSGSSGNFKANGITSRELEDTLLGVLSGGFGNVQEGVKASADGVVSPSSNMTVAVSAITGAAIRDDSGLLAAGELIRASYAGGTVTVGNAHATLPRIDQIIFTLTGWNTATVSVLAGTATAAAQCKDPLAANYRLGAAALPSDSIRLSDVEVTAADTVIDAAQIIDRRPFATLGKKAIATSESITATSFTVATTKDIIGSIVVPEASFINVLFQARVIASAAGGAGQIAIFIVNNATNVATQLKVADMTTGVRAVVTEAAVTNGADDEGFVVSSPIGLVGADPTGSGLGADVTTGQAVAYVGQGTAASRVSMNNAAAATLSGQAPGGPCAIRLPAGTYDIVIGYKVSSGNMSVSARHLFAWSRS
jgi:hypothetical protein